MVRNQIIFANTQFLGACFHPSGVQLITCGTDRKIGYWEALDGSMLRELEGSESSAVNSVQVSRDGLRMVSAGNDTYVKLWSYQDGLSTHYGIGHAANVMAVKFSPDSKLILSVSADGGIFQWRCPFPLPDDFDDRHSEYCSTKSTCSDREARWGYIPKKVDGAGDDEENVEKCSSELSESVRSVSAKSETKETKPSTKKGAKAKCECDNRPNCLCDEAKSTSSKSSKSSNSTRAKIGPSIAEKSRSTPSNKSRSSKGNTPSNKSRSSKGSTPLKDCRCPPDLK